jgi:hypothetical protein
MALEHRWSARRSVNLEAIVFHRPMGLLPVRILDIGLEGAFIAGEDLKLPVPGGTLYHMSAIVIHYSRDGYGVMFKEFKLEAFRTLMDVLYAA